MSDFIWEPIVTEKQQPEERRGILDIFRKPRPKPPADQYFGLDITEAEQFVQENNIPEDRLKEAAGDVYLGQLLGVPPEEAASMLESIRKEDPNWAKGLSEIKPNWQSGWTDLQLGQIMYQRLLLTLQLNNKDPEKRKAAEDGIQAIDAQAGKLEANRPEVADPSQQGLFWRALSSASRMAPIMLKGLEKGAQLGLVTGGGAAGMAALLGQAGPQVGLPEELITVPGAFAVAFGIGASTGSAQFIMQVEAGLSLVEMLREGIDPNVAAAASLGVGIINSLIEVVQIGDIMKSIPGLDAIVRKATNQAAKAVVKSGVLKALARGVMQAGKHTAIETIQELAQESTSIAAEELGKVLTNALNEVMVRKPGARMLSKLEPATIEEIVDRYKQTAIDSALGFGVMQLPGMAARTVTGIGKVAPRGAEKVAAKPEAGIIKPREETIITRDKSMQDTEIKTDILGNYAPEAHIFAGHTEDRTYWIIKAMHDTGLPDIRYSTYEEAETAAKSKGYEIDRTINLRNEPEATLIHQPTLEAMQTAGKWMKPVAQAGQDIYVRYGKIPESGRSIDRITGQQEQGVSVFRARLQDDKLLIRVKTPQELVDTEMLKDRPLFTITGQEIGIGADGEPVLRVKNAQEIIPSKIAIISEDKFLELVEKEIKPKPEVRKGPPEIAKILAEATTEIRAPIEEKPMTIEAETYTSQEVAAARKEARQTTIEELAQEITGTGKRAIGKAVTVGEKIGIEEQKALQRDVALRKKIREETREHANKLARIIKKAQDPAVGIDYEYAEGMRALASEIDPAFRTERTLQRRQALLDFIKRDPEAAAKIPKSILDMAQKKSLNELTTEDLERTVMAINKLQKLGRKKRTLQIRVEKKARQAELSTLTVEAMEGKEPIEVEGKGIATLKKEGRHHLLHGANVWFLRPQRIIDRIGGGKGTFQTENSKSLWNRAQRITNEQIIGKDERYKVGVDKMKALEINPRWLSKNHTIGETTYTNGELLGLYAGSKNELSKVAIMMGNNLTEKQIDAFVAKLTDEGKAWADWIIGEYEKNRPRLQEAHISYTNKPFYVEENYTPLRYLDAVYGTMKEELGKELLEREGLKKAYADRGFTISRLTKIPKEFRRQVNLDLTGLWFDQVAKQENYVRNARDIKMLQHIVSNKKWSDAVRQKLGPEYVKVTREWVNRVVDPDYYKTYDAANKISSALRRNFALAKLVFNAGTVLKQAPSWALALADIGPRLVTVSLRAPFQAGMMLERMHRLSPQMRHRAVIRELEELKVMDRNLYQKIQKEVGRYGMMPIYAMDKAIVTLVWNGQFEKSVAQGLSETEAAMEADNVVQRTQPAAAPKDQAQIFMSSEALNWLNMFGNQLNQIWNMISYDIPQRFVGGIKKGNAKQVTQAMIGVMGIMMSGASIWMISKRRLPEDENDLKEMLGEQFITAIPIVGRNIVQAMHGYEEGGIPAIEEASKLFTAAIGKGYWKKRLDRALEAIAALAGFPEIAVKRTIKAIKTGRPIELIGGRPRD